MNDNISSFFGNNSPLMILLIGIVLLFIIVSVLRSVFRIILPFLVIGLVMVVFLGHSPEDVLSKGRNFVLSGSSYIQEKLFPFFRSGETDDKGIPRETPPELSPFSEEQLEEFFNKSEGEEKETIGGQEEDSGLNKF